MITLAESEQRAYTESPMHAFLAVNSAPVEFWRLGARCVSTVPAFGKYSCLKASGDGLTDVENFYNFCTSHTWDYLYDSLGPQEYKQNDTLDPDTFEALTSTVLVDTQHFNGIGNPPTWNNQFAYFTLPGLTSTGVDWDKAPTRTGILATLDAIDWAAYWAGTASDNYYLYNRVQISANNSGHLPYTGGTYPLGAPPATGLIVAQPGEVPQLALTGTVGLVGGAASKSDDLGVSLSRTQIQIRNFIGAPIPYFILEQTGASTSIAGNTPTGGGVYYRKVSEGTWTADRQIIQLPDAAMDGPQRITTPAGAAVRNGTVVSMVVGMTFEDYMLSLFGPSWSDYVFT